MRILGVLAASLALCLASIPVGNELLGAQCAQERRLRSLEGTTSTSITFVNYSRDMIRTYWIDYWGVRKFCAAVPPGGSHVQQTFPAHPWAVTNSQGNWLTLREAMAKYRRI